MNRVMRIFAQTSLLALFLVTLSSCAYQSPSGDTQVQGGGTISAGAAF